MEASNPIGATRTTFRIVEALVEREGATVSELAASLSVTKGTVHNHLATLQELGYVTKDGGVYHPALRFLAPATRSRQRSPLAMVPTGAASDLAASTGQRVDLVALEGDRSVLVYTESGEQYEGEYSVVGSVVPLYCTAPGKAILAHADHVRVEDALAAGDGERAGRAITDPPELRRELTKVRGEGLAHDRTESAPNVRGIAAPVFQSGTVRGAIGVLGAADDMRGKTFQQDIPGLVISAGERLSKQLENNSTDGADSVP
jgi:DNA-binding IclR family transcriptional regulator